MNLSPYACSGLSTRKNNGTEKIKVEDEEVRWFFLILKIGTLLADIHFEEHLFYTQEPEHHHCHIWMMFRFVVLSLCYNLFIMQYYVTLMTGCAARRRMPVLTRLVPTSGCEENLMTT